MQESPNSESSDSQSIKQDAMWDEMQKKMARKIAASGSDSSSRKFVQAIGSS